MSASRPPWRPGPRGSARWMRGSATCSARASPPTSRPRRAPSSRCPASPDWDAKLLDVFGVRTRRCRPSWTRRASSASCATRLAAGAALRAQIVDQQAALAGAGCVVPERVKATYGTGVFVLANVGEHLPDGGAEGLFPTVAWRIGGTVEFALDGGVFTAGALLNWLSEDLGLAPDAAGLAATAAQVEDSGGVRILPRSPGSALPGGARKPTRSCRDCRPARGPGTSRGRRSRRSPGGSRTSWPSSPSTCPWTCCASTVNARPAADAAPGGHRRCAGAARRGGRDRGRLRGARGGGRRPWGSTAEIAERLPVGERVEPGRDDDWRAREHADWRHFVEVAAAAL